MNPDFEANARSRSSQSGNILSLLLGLILLLVVLYFAFKPGTPHTDGALALNCEPLIKTLVQNTGGVGPQAQQAYAQLPPECRKLLPDPAMLAPTPEHLPATASEPPQ